MSRTFGATSRREVLLGGAALALAGGFPARSRAAAADTLSLAGSPVQGGLVEGHVTPGTQIFVAGKPVRADGGIFCFGFNYDDADPVEVRAVYPDGRNEMRAVAPRTREFDVQRIDGLPERYVSPPQDVLEQIRRDARVVVEARNHDIDETWFADEFMWPVDGIITGNFGNRRILNGEPRAPHFGVDIAVPEGTPIKAPTDGIVRLAEFLYLSGNTTIIDHGHGVSTTYLHASRLNVAVGDRLNKGDVFALAGQTGRATGPHVCWRMNWFQTRLDVALKAPERA